MHKLLTNLDAFATYNESTCSSRKYFSKNLFQTSKKHEETIIFYAKNIELTRVQNFNFRSRISS